MTGTNINIGTLNERIPNFVSHGIFCGTVADGAEHLQLLRLL